MILLILLYIVCFYCWIVKKTGLCAADLWLKQVISCINYIKGQKTYFWPDVMMSCLRDVLSS